MILEYKVLVNFSKFKVDF